MPDDSEKKREEKRKDEREKDEGHRKRMEEKGKTWRVQGSAPKDDETIYLLILKCKKIGR